MKIEESGYFQKLLYVLLQEFQALHKFQTHGHLQPYSFVSNKRRVANKRRVWKTYQNLINKGSGTNQGPGIFVTLYKKVFENSHFFRFSLNVSMIFFQK